MGVQDGAGQRREVFDRLPEVEAGSVVRGTLRSSAEALADMAWPFTIVRGGQDGPRVVVMSGVHPTEYPAIEAVIRVARELDPARLSGTVVFLPLVNVPSFLSRTPFVSPLDRVNPNRVFPGDPDGGVTQRLVDFIWRTVIAGADALIDLHGGDMIEDLTPCTFYTLTGNGETDAATEALARAFGLPIAIPFTVEMTSEPASTVPAGTSDEAAARAGIPAILTESGGRGLLTETETRLNVEGIHRALRHLGVLPGGPPDVAPVITATGYQSIASPAEGMWYPAVRPGAAVREGQKLGEIRDLFGDHLADVTSPFDGLVLYLTSAPAMPPGGLTVAIART